MPNIATISSAVMLEIVLALADLGKDLFAGPVLHEEVAADCGIVGAQEGIGFLFDRDRRRNGEPAFGACCLDIPGAGLQADIVGVDAECEASVRQRIFMAEINGRFVAEGGDRQSVVKGTSWSVRVDLGGGGGVKKKKRT